MSTKATPQEGEETIQAQDIPVTILAQYIRDLSFENPNAFDVLNTGPETPKMDLNIGMDARKVPDQSGFVYEVVLSVKAEAEKQGMPMFIAELQYAATVQIGDEIPEDSHHPFLLIEIPRLMFPFARQILSNLTVQGGYPPLLMNPVDFHALYMQRFGAEIEAARQDVKDELRADVSVTASEAVN